MRVISIKKLTSGVAIAALDGERLNKSIESYMLMGERVTLDFYGVTKYSALFFQRSIGPLYRGFSVDRVDELLEVANLNDAGLRLLNQVREQCIRYEQDSAFRDAVNDLAWLGVE